MKAKETDFEPQKPGEHLKKKRLELGLTQKSLARILQVSPFSVINWERGKFQPTNVFTLHRIIGFLGYDPLPKGTTIGELLRAKRRERGWGQRELADYLVVDRCTVTNWELGGTILKRSDRVMLAQFLGVPEEALVLCMGDQWNEKHGRRSVSRR